MNIERTKYIINKLIKLNKLAITDLHYLFKSNRQEEKIFCVNSGGCGSMYIVKLLEANGIKQCYHQKNPELDELGVKYYLNGKQPGLIKLILYLTRKSIYFESSNRLFSLTSLIKEVFPGSKFIHLYRNGRDTLNSNMNKTIWPDWIINSQKLRYRSMLAGPREFSPFVRSCLYWTNYNERIIDDLKSQDYLGLKFEDLIAGRLDELENFIGKKLKIKKIKPANIKKHIKKAQKRFETWEDWPERYKSKFDELCGKTMQKMGYE